MSVVALMDAKFPTSKSNFLRPFGFPKSSKVSISVAFWLCKALWILYISPDARPTSEIMHKQIWKIDVALVVIFIVNVESIFHKLEFFNREMRGARKCGKSRLNIGVASSAAGWAWVIDRAVGSSHLFGQGNLL